MDRNETPANADFDPRRLAARRERANRIGRDDAGFLVDLAAEEIAGRLQATLRDFRVGLDIATPTPALSQTLRAMRPDLHLERVQEADIPAEPERADLAVSALGLHWSNDLPGAFARIRRALKPDGLFMAALPGDGTLGELRECLIAAEAELTSGAARRVDAFVDVRQAGALLQRAGFALPVADIEHHTVRYGSVATLVADLRAMGATSARAGRVETLPRAIMERLEKIYAERFADPDGRLRATFSIIYLTGWVPHESQQKPLQPGSAQVRLGDVLKRD